MVVTNEPVEQTDGMIVRTRSFSFSKPSSDSDIQVDPTIVDLIDPGFMFLQLQPYPTLKQSFHPIVVNLDDQNKRAIGILDRTPVIDLHKIGIVYVGPKQTNEVEILKNTSGSPFYTEFLRAIGTTFELAQTKIFTGGLDTSADCLDGKFAICFVPDQRLSQVIFHVTTMMPTLPHDTQCIGKKRHIGNDYVTIVWNESGLPYRPETIPSQFNLVQIIIEPISGFEYSNYGFRVQVLFSESMNEMTPSPVLVNGSALASYVRQTSIFSNMMAQVHVNGETTSNSKERLRQIKRLRQRIEGPAVDTPLDFTHYLK
jgi:hypothetical protein